MIDLDEAKRLVQQYCRPLASATVPLSRALDHALARPVKTRFPLPRFDATAVDGYAVRARDIENARPGHVVELPVIGMIRAGDAPGRLKPGTTVKIMTGAPIPSGCDAVVKKEDVVEQRRHAVFSRRAPRGENIRRRGGEFRRGEMLLEKGERVTPPAAGLLAAAGFDKVCVFRKPSVALIITGNEFRLPPARLCPGEIYDANSYALKAAVQKMGVPLAGFRRIKDERGALCAAFSQALSVADVVISVGGVSAGDFDLVRPVLEKLGVDIVFHGIAMKPGKPTLFGTRKKKLVFGLPGNPVSALLSFNFLVRPALGALMGLPVWRPLSSRAILTSEVVRSSTRVEFIRGRLTQNGRNMSKVTPVRAQDSHMLSSLSGANCLIRFPRYVLRLRKSSLVEVELLDWG